MGGTMRIYAGGNGLSDRSVKYVKSIQEEAVGTEWIDRTIRRILAAQVFITVLFFYCCSCCRKAYDGGGLFMAFWNAS